LLSPALLVYAATPARSPAQFLGRRSRLTLNAGPEKKRKLNRGNSIRFGSTSYLYPSVELATYSTIKADRTASAADPANDI
jgi:hypothetical protein